MDIFDDQSSARQGDEVKLTETYLMAGESHRHREGSELHERAGPRVQAGAEPPDMAALMLRPPHRLICGNPFYKCCYSLRTPTLGVLYQCGCTFTIWGSSGQGLLVFRPVIIWQQTL